jgi:hypothetical protein
MAAQSSRRHARGTDRGLKETSTSAGGKFVWRAPRSGGYQPSGVVPEPEAAPRGSAGTSTTGSPKA